MSSTNILLHYRYQNCRRIRGSACSPVRVRSPASALACAFRAVWISYISKKSEFKIWCGIRLLNFNRISFWAPCGNQSSIRASQYVAFDDPPPSHTHTHTHTHTYIYIYTYTHTHTHIYIYTYRFSIDHYSYMSCMLSYKTINFEVDNYFSYKSNIYFAIDHYSYMSYMLSCKTINFEVDNYISF
jgi:hypothetical protein